MYMSWLNICMFLVTEEDLDLTVVAVGKRFHPACVKCAMCELPLSTVKMLSEGKLYCGNCYRDKLAPVCNHCNGKIVGRSLRIDWMDFHIDCVKCPKCSFKICDNEGVYIVEGGSLPVHMDCSKSVSSEFYKITTDDEAIFSTFEDHK